MTIMIYNGEASYNGTLNQNANIEMVNFTHETHASRMNAIVCAIKPEVLLVR